MQRLFAIVWLTWKAAFRFRLFLVITVLLLAAVVGLPLILKDDGTARGFTQILLTYTLSSITGLLGLCTLWLSCGILARDLEECQMQVVAVKPIARWQIWLGKWLGLITLNAALLAIAGTAVFCLLQWRATKLPVHEQEVLRDEVLVARGSAREASYETELDLEVARRLETATKNRQLSAPERAEVARQLREQLKAELQVVAPGAVRIWQIDLSNAGSAVRDLPLQLRIKFNSAQNPPSGTWLAAWRAGTPEKTQLWESGPLSLAPDTFHEISLPPGLVDENGVLTVLFLNPNNTALLFPLDGGMEVLYRESGFGLNFVRGLAIILGWMALLAAIGLAAASFLSFPVAAFFALALLTLTFSSGTLASTVETGSIAGSNEETGVVGSSALDVVLIPVFKGLLSVVRLVQDFSPVDALSSGRAITWSTLGQAWLQSVVLLGGGFIAFGMFVFNRRELAAAQGLH